jgi:hypothetical protein
VELGVDLLTMYRYVCTRFIKPEVFYSGWLLVASLHDCRQERGLDTLCLLLLLE